MGIGSLGFAELIVIFVIVLVFFGPRRFPEIARSMGHAMREFRRSLNQIQRELEDADPRSAMPGRDFLNDLGKPSQWLDPNSPRETPSRPTSSPAGNVETESGGQPETESGSDPEGGMETGSSQPDTGEQLPMFEGGEESAPDTPTADKPIG